MLSLATPEAGTRVGFRPYEHERHRRFVFGTFLPAVADTPGAMSASRERHGKALEHVLRSPDARVAILTPSPAPDELMGWAVAMPWALIFVHVAYQYRRGRIGFHFGSALVEHVWDFQEKEIPCALWTRAASRMAAKGFPWRYDLDQHEQFIELAR